jgi:hypothetical protein
MMLVGIATIRLAAAAAPFARSDFIVCSTTGIGFTGEAPDEPPTHGAARTANPDSVGSIRG